MPSFEIIQGDITTFDVDAIVNAANPALAPGGGVCGAIHRAAGPELAQECAQRFPMGAHTGEAVITRGFNLPARAIIHAVGPKWTGDSAVEDALLERTYRSILREAGRYEIRSLALPAISTGIYGFPLERATEIAIRTLMAGMNTGVTSVQHVVCATFDARTTAVYEGMIAALSPTLYTQASEV